MTDAVEVLCSKEVKDGFYGSFCKSLKSLEGSPKEIKGGFYCAYCSSLQSLEGSPKEVGVYFNCSGFVFIFYKF